jgi:iron complex outermembrane receptor protein
LGHWGFRADWQISEKDTLTFQGDGYDGKAGQVKPSVIITGRTGPAGKLVVGLAGGNGLARWSHAIGPESEFHLRVYYDRSYRNDPTFVDDLDTIDLDFQHRFPLPLNQDVLWGVNYRLMANQDQGKGVFEVRPSESQDNLFSGFVQDRISIFKSLRLTLGTKLEHNDFSGFEIQPSGRLAWDPFTGHTVWLSVSRAVRVPTRLERDLFITISESARVAVRLLGNKAFTSEKLWAYEIGYRWEATKELFIDLAGFYNHYRGLASLEYGATFIDPQDGRTNVPLVYQNATGGVGKGVEAAVTFTPIRFWRLKLTYSNLVLTLDPKGQDLTNLKLVQAASPRHQVGLQSFLDLPAHLRLDGFFRYVSALRGSPEGAAGQEIPGYASLDVRVAWQAWKSVEISLVGQSLLQAHHPEFFGGTEVQRGVYGKLAGVF